MYYRCNNVGLLSTYTWDRVFNIWISLPQHAIAAQPMSLMIYLTKIFFFISYAITLLLWSYPYTCCICVCTERKQALSLSLQSPFWGIDFLLSLSNDSYESKLYIVELYRKLSNSFQCNLLLILCL